MVLSIYQELLICYTEPIIVGLGGFTTRLGSHQRKCAEGNMFRFMVVKRDAYKLSGMGCRPPVDPWGLALRRLISCWYSTRQRPGVSSNKYSLITQCLAENMRKRNYGRVYCFVYNNAHGSSLYNIIKHLTTRTRLYLLLLMRILEGSWLCRATRP